MISYLDSGCDRAIHPDIYQAIAHREGVKTDAFAAIGIPNSQLELHGYI